jgi:hypothetical protein
VLCVGLLFAASPALAQPGGECDGTVGGTYVRWSSPTTGTASVASAIASDTGFGAAASRAFFAQGKKLFAFRNVADGGFAAGTKVWEWCASPSAACTSATTLNNFPSPTPLSSAAGMPSEVIFVGASDGFLYKINALAAVIPSPNVDTRRKISGVLVCNGAPGDSLNATPAVALYAYADSTLGTRGRAFRDNIDATPGHAGDDVVIVITDDGCSDTTHNRIIAYWARDLSQKWVVNADFSIKMDKGTEGCTIDYTNMWLFCGTDLQDGSSGQDSLFAIDIINGMVLWSTNAGAILNRPILNFNNHRLYVANKAGSLMAYNPVGNGLGGGAPLWSAALSVASVGTLISRSPSVESRGSSWQNKILVLDTGGTLHAVTDNGMTGSVLWTASAEAGVTWMTVPVVLPDPTASRAFLGRSDGYLQMVQLGTTFPTIQGIVAVQFPTQTFDPSLDIEGNAVRLDVVAGTTIERITVPICPNPPF